MTGEMSSPVDREEWRLHAAIADAFDGELRPFDVYQGPYVLIDRPEGGTAKLWIVPYEEFPDYMAQVFDERTRKLSEPIHVHHDDAVEMVIVRASEVTGIAPKGTTEQI